MHVRCETEEDPNFDQFFYAWSEMHRPNYDYKDNDFSFTSCFRKSELKKKSVMWGSVRPPSTNCETITHKCNNTDKVIHMCA